MIIPTSSADAARAAALTAIHANYKKAAIPTPEMTANRVQDFALLEALNDDELATVNAFRRQNGRPPYQQQNLRPFGKPKAGTGNGNGNSTTAKKYRYSQKMGHMQMECRSRLRDKPLMVNASRQPYKSVNTIKENADMGESTVIVKSISTSGNNLIAPLNWN